MKTLWALLPPFIKGAVTVVIFFVSLGWASYGAVLLIVKAEGQEIEKKVMDVRKIDMEHLDKRFDQVISEIRSRK
jgi:hypothetical protein